MRNLLSLLSCLLAQSAAGGPTSTGTAVELLQTPSLRIVRIEPSQVVWQVGLATEAKQPPRTAATWAARLGALAVINAGMYQEDHLKNVGYLRHGEHVNNASWKKSYQSVFLLGPRRPKLPAATMVDLDEPGAAERVAQYTTAIQNLRLIKAPGVGVWKPNGRAWSEAAVALDDHGRVLFVFSREALEMSAFTQQLLEAKLGIVRAMHVEGGPEASLSLRLPGRTAEDLSGNFEKGIFSRTDNATQWALPNVIAVAPQRRAPSP